MIYNVLDRLIDSIDYSIDCLSVSFSFDFFADLYRLLRDGVFSAIRCSAIQEGLPEASHELGTERCTPFSLTVFFLVTGMTSVGVLLAIRVS